MRCSAKAGVKGSYSALTKGEDPARARRTRGPRNGHGEDRTLRKPGKIALGLVAAVFLAAALFQFAGVGKTSVRYKGSFFDIFDTYSEITVYADTEADGAKMVDAAHEELLAYHRLYDIYNDYEGLTNLKTVNEQAGAAPVAVDGRIIDLLTFAKEMAKETDGRMNVAMGSVLALWHTHREAGIADPANATLPATEELRAAAAHTDIDDLIIDADAKTVYFADPALRLDVGAVAKGYAVEQVARHMAESGVTSALLSIGGNVRAVGAKGDGSLWRVDVQNPDLAAATQSLMTLDLDDLSLVTSGSYQRYYTVDGKQYCHIIDPDTLYPAEYVWAVSVVTQDSGLADALSTALFTLPVEQGMELLQKFPGVEALWVNPDGSLTRSDGFTALTQEETAAE
jgi:FAD:protein FMN transferase